VAFVTARGGLFRALADVLLALHGTFGALVAGHLILPLGSLEPSAFPIAQALRTAALGEAVPWSLTAALDPLASARFRALPTGVTPATRRNVRPS
jgi:hypothetical protein